MPRLIIEAPAELEGQVFELVGSELSVGRTSDNSIFIDHGSVSSRHASLTAEDGDYLINDLNSTNGTRINGQRTVRQRLQRGDTLFIGNVQLRYESEVGPEIQPLPAITHGIELDAANQSVRPGDFVNASPYPKPKGDPADQVAKILAIVFAVTAVGGLGFLLFKLFSTPA